MKILTAAKAYAALIGAAITAVLGLTADGSEVRQILTIVLAVVTAVATYSVPNKKAAA